jgi:hypothetical protein
MKENWILVYTNIDLYQVKIAEDVLKQNGIVSHILEKGDSAIPSLGEVRLYTQPEDAEKARTVLEENDIK